MQYINLINKKRLIKIFIELVKIPSLSKKEGKFAAYLTKKLKSLGCKVYIDKSAKKTGSDTGNIIAYLKGMGKKPILLCAHMDTVAPAIGIKPRIKKDRLVSGGKTILAADDKAGIAIILEVLQIIKENKSPHPPVEIVLTTCEEMGLLGAKNLEYRKIKSKYGITLDNEYLGMLTVKSPKSVIMETHIKGKESHSGLEPEKGISAIKIAADAVSKLKLGRIDKETVCNINTMEAGTAVNIIAPNAILKGDIRSHSTKKLNRQIKLLQKTFKKSAKKYAKKIDGKLVKPSVNFKIIPICPHLKVPVQSPIIGLLKKSSKKYKVKLKLTSSVGASDANILCGSGILAPNLGLGVGKVHTTGEYLLIDDFFKTAGIVTDVVYNFRN